MYGAGAAFFALSRSRPNLVGAGVGFGTSDSRSHPKKWRPRNTAIGIQSNSTVPVQLNSPRPPDASKLSDKMILKRYQPLFCGVAGAEG